MSYKPFSALALVDQYKIGGDYALAVNTQQAFQALELADFDGVLIKRIVGPGMSIDQNGALTITGAAQAKGLQSIGVGAAATVTKTFWGQHLYHRTFSIGLYLPNTLLGEACVFYRIKNQTAANIFEFGKDSDDNLYAKVGNSGAITSGSIEQGPDYYTPFAMENTPALFECGICLTDTNYYFHYYGFAEASAAIPTYELPGVNTTFTVDLLEGCLGAKLAYVRLLKGLRYPANSAFTPMCKGISAARLTYYDFEETEGDTIYDDSDAAADLTLTDDGERVII